MLFLHLLSLTTPLFNYKREREEEEEDRGREREEEEEEEKRYPGKAERSAYEVAD